jgi:hypothetical protein
MAAPTVLIGVRVGLRYGNKKKDVKLRGGMKCSGKAAEGTQHYNKTNECHKINTYKLNDMSVDDRRKYA